MFSNLSNFPACYMLYDVLLFHHFWEYKIYGQTINVGVLNLFIFLRSDVA